MEKDLMSGLTEDSIRKVDSAQDVNTLHGDNSLLSLSWDVRSKLMKGALK
jgi:hypothetical protein